LPKPVALFPSHDVRGRQILDACLFAGIKIPYHVAVLSVDNDELICEATEPTMSSIVIDTESGSYAVAEMLDGLMRGIIKEQQKFL
jgi:LacI family transcriptional regulator